MAEAIRVRPLGKTGITVSSISIGGGPIGGMKDLFGFDTPERHGVETAKAGFLSRFLLQDTSADYSEGESERRIGLAIKELGGVPAGHTVQTKVPAALGSAEAVRQSVYESMERLGLDELPIVLLHDPEFYGFEQTVRAGGSLEGLIKLRDEGVVQHIGLGMGSVPMLNQFLDLGFVEIMLVHNRMSLVDRSADQLIDKAASLGIGVLNAAVYGGGVLARGTTEVTTYGYRPMSEDQLAKVRRLEQLCAQAGIPLAAAALQFSLRDERISSTVVGVEAPGRIAELEQLATAPIPEGFWDEAESSVFDRADWLD